MKTISIFAATWFTLVGWCWVASARPEYTSNALKQEAGHCSEAVQVRWLEDPVSELQQGTAFGVPWPMGTYPQGTEFTLRTGSGEAIPLQSWKTAIWPDGSLKWTGHALAPGTFDGERFEILPGKSVSHSSPVSVQQGADAVLVDTGVIQCRLSIKGEALISEVKRGGSPILVDGRLTGMVQASPEPGTKVKTFTSWIQSVAVEKSGPVRAVIKVDGVHRIEGRSGDSREWLPFSVRLYFHAGSDSIRMTHTFVFDGDENRDFIRGLGVRFNVPMYDEPYNRHVRFVGQNGGLWAEAVQGLTGLSRDPGEDVRAAQIAGRKVPDIHTWSEQVRQRIHWVPTWGDVTLSQPNANGFTIRKRTKSGHGWIHADQGTRADGLAYVGGVSGGVAFGMRDFWKLHPTQLDIRNANTDAAEVTLWIWSPDAPPMDIRFYHDGMGQEKPGPIPEVMIEGIETSVPDHPYEKQTDAMKVTYEDYEPGFGTPNGVARSSDIYLKVCTATPSREALVRYAEEISLPPQLVPLQEDLLEAKAFGGGTVWSLPNRSAPALAAMEDRLDWSIRFYRDQVEQRHWYGFWDYGDVMHTYDSDRHVWRYDIGGFAWDNSELSTDMWLWYSFLRTGDSTAFRLAEAMNRHNRDVDIYHLGRFAGFGTRHNVQHWGCSAKQLRVSTCMNRRFHYFLTTDERTGDVLQEVVDADRQLANLNAHRKVMFDPKKNKTFFEPPEGCRISVGTDYGAALANWLTAWERTGDPEVKGWIENSMRAVGNAKGGFFVNRYTYDPETRKMTAPEGEPLMVSHLSIMFGLPEVVAEVVELIDIPAFKEAWIQYGTLLYASDQVMTEALGSRVNRPGSKIAHARVMAYAAVQSGDETLKEEAARFFFDTPKKGRGPVLATQRINGSTVLNPVDEATWVSTNGSAQWGLAAIQTSALIPDDIVENQQKED